MADHSIFFRIGSTFSGEGFTKAQQTIKRTNGEIRQSAGIANQLAEAVGGVDKSCAKAASAISGLIGALASGNVLLMAITAGVTAMMFIIDKWKAEAAKAKEKTEELRKAAEKAFDNEIRGKASEYLEELKKIASEFDFITKQANALTAAMEGVAKSTATGGVLNLEVEKINALIDAQSDATRQTIEAQYNLKIAIEKSANSEFEWNLKIENAHQAIVDAQNRVAMYDQQYAESVNKRKELELKYADRKAMSEEQWAKVDEQLKQLWEFENSVVEKRAQEIVKITELEEQEKLIKQDAINAQAQSTIAIRQAELAQKKLNDAKEAERVAAEAERAATELDAAAKNESADIFAMANKSQLRLDDATRKLEQAERNYAALLQKWVDNPMQAGANAVAKNGGSKFGDAIGKSKEDFVNAAIAAGIANGSIKNSKDIHNVAKDAGRAFNDGVASGDATQAGRDEQWYNALKKKNPKLLTKAEKDFLENMDKIKNKNAEDEKKRKQAEDDAKEAKKKKEEAEKVKDQNIADMKKTLDSINTKLDDVGLQ